MAQRSSRSKKSRARASEVKKPQLRTPRADKSAKVPAEPARGLRPQRRREVGPKLRVRPDGRGGFAVMALGGWLVVAGIAALGLALQRWNSYGQADALWLYVAIGMVAAAIPVGYVARRLTDVRSWLAQATVIALALYALEVLTQDGCAPGSACSAFGRHDAVGAIVTVGTIAVLVVLADLLATRTLRWTQGRRGSGRTSATITLSTMVWAGVLLGLPLGALLIGVDAIARPEPALVAQAKEQVAECFALGDKPHELSVRPDPLARSTAWTSLLVRRTAESRKVPTGPKGKLQETSYTGPGMPYEAVAIYSDAVDEETPAGFDVNCRRIAPGSGTATASDFAPLTETELQQNPIKPNEALTAPTPAGAPGSANTAAAPTVTAG